MLSQCQFCEKEFTVGKNCTGKYCSNSCQAAEKSKTVVDTWLAEPSKENFYTGVSPQPRKSIREFLIKKHNCKCTRCGWDKRHQSAKFPALEIEHIDGNWENCDPGNVTIICPNCHSLTDTYKARNAGNGREHRRTT